MKSAENPENDISGATAPEVDNVTEFIEGFREKDANDFTVLPDPNNMGLKEGKQYEMVVGRHAHPNEREVRGMKAGFQKPKFRKMSERDFVDKIGQCGCRNPNCWICFLVDGVPRRFMKIVDLSKSSANPCKDQPNANDGIALAELESQLLPKSNYCPTKMALLIGQANQASRAKQA